MAAEGTNAQLEAAREGRGEDDPKTKREKQLERQDLHRRGRGVMQIKPVRSMYHFLTRLPQYSDFHISALKWMGDGFKSKVNGVKSMIKPSLTGKQRKTSFLTLSDSFIDLLSYSRCRDRSIVIGQHPKSYPRTIPLCTLLYIIYLCVP